MEMEKTTISPLYKDVVHHPNETTNKKLVGDFNPSQKY